MKDYTAFAMEILTVPDGTATAVSLTETKYKPAAGGLPVSYARITVDPGPVIRYTVDGTTVTTGTGHGVTAFGMVELYGYDSINKFSTISTKTATAGQITVTYFK